MCAYGCLPEWWKGRCFCQIILRFTDLEVLSVFHSLSHTLAEVRSLLLLIIMSVCFVVSVIQISLLLQHASEIQSSEMLFVTMSQYNNVVFSLNCAVLRIGGGVGAVNRAFTDRCAALFFFKKPFALYQKRVRIQECPANPFLNNQSESLTVNTLNYLLHHRTDILLVI